MASTITHALRWWRVQPHPFARLDNPSWAITQIKTPSRDQLTVACHSRICEIPTCVIVRPLFKLGLDTRGREDQPAHER